MISLCSQDSRKILEIEENIKNNVKSDKNIFLMLISIFSQWPQYSQESFTAGIILKNCIKNHYSEMNPLELQSIEQVALIMIVMQQKKDNMTKKHYMLLLDIIIAIIKKKFFEDVSNTELLESIISLYNLNFCLCNLDCLIRVFEQVDDDRMHRFVKLLLPISIKMLKERHRPILRNKLMYFI